MTDYPNETVTDAANRLMNALALHEDARGTVTDFLHDMWDAGRDTTAALALAPARLIHDDARALVNRSAVLTRTAHLRILANTEKLIASLGEKTGIEDHGGAPAAWCAHHGWDSDNPRDHCPDCPGGPRYSVETDHTDTTAPYVIRDRHTGLLHPDTDARARRADRYPTRTAADHAAYLLNVAHDNGDSDGETD